MNNSNEDKWIGWTIQEDERLKCIECHALKHIKDFYTYDEICKTCLIDDTEHPFHQNPE